MIEYLIPQPRPIHSGVFNFYDPDSEEHFEKNKSLYGKDWANYWNNRPITYKINSLGYRMNEIEEINQNNYILTLGCSNTFGIGIPLEETWAYKLSKHLSADLINGSAPGSSNELVLINLIRVLTNLKLPKLVVVDWTQVNRKLFWENNKLVFHLPHCYLGRNNVINKDKKNWFKEIKWESSYNEYLINEKEVYSAFDEIKNQVVGLCKVNNIPLWMITQFGGYGNYEDVTKFLGYEVPFNVYDRARDIDHFGPKFQNEILRSFIKTNKNV